MKRKLIVRDVVNAQWEKMHWVYHDDQLPIQPRHDRVLVKRIEGPPTGICITDAPKSIKGKVLAVGPEVDTLKPGMLVLFNSKWNDLAHAENQGTGADGKGPLERPLSYKLDKNIHLVREADIFGILTGDVPAKLGRTTLEQEFLVNKRIAGPWSEA